MTISVVIPAYNRAHRVPAAIESVLRQGVGDVEIIVVDDGSVDNTRDVVSAYGSQITYVHQRNAGVGAARNTGIRHASGDLIAFLDSDDRWHDFKLGAQLALLRARPDVGLVFSDFEIERPDGVRIGGGASAWAGRDLDFPEMHRLEIRYSGGPEWPSPTIECWAGPMYRQLLDELPVLTSSVIVRRSVLDETTWYAERVTLFEDWEFFARVARRANVGYVTESTTVNVGHTDPGRVSKCSNVDRAECYVTLLERVWLADPGFTGTHGHALRSAYGRALLAFAREAVLAGHATRAKRALEAWRRGGFTERRAWAAIYQACAQLERGGALLRHLLRARTMIRLIAPVGARRTYGQVNPAA